MKSPILRHLLTLSAGLALSQAANATLLAGWYSFEANNNDEAAEPSQVASGFSGNLIKGALTQGGAAGTAGGGSNDNHYGSDSNPALSTGPSDNGTNGYLRLLGTGITPNGTSSNRHVFELTNDSGGPTSITDIFFDAANAGAKINVSYQIGAGPTVALGTQTIASNTADYSDFTFQLLGTPLLSVGQTIKFIFTQTGGGARIDNIAIAGISAVPEPGSLLAIGCVLGSGLLLRNRRSRQVLA